jgi:hypothetical protein
MRRSRRALLLKVRSRREPRPVLSTRSLMPKGGSRSPREPVAKAPSPGPKDRCQDRPQSGDRRFGLLTLSSRRLLLLSRDQRQRAPRSEVPRAWQQTSAHGVRDLPAFPLLALVVRHRGHGLPVGERLEDRRDGHGAGYRGKADGEEGEAPHADACPDQGDRGQERKRRTELEPGKSFPIGLTFACRQRYARLSRRVGSAADVAAEGAGAGLAFREEPGAAVGAELRLGNSNLLGWS